MSDLELILELEKRGFISKTKSRVEVLSRFKEGEEISLIMSNGLPSGIKKCSQCFEDKDKSEFAFYRGRIDKTGYLAPSNSVCKSCRDKHKTELDNVKKSTNMPPKPKSGDVCEGCNREWEGNWHYHHQEDVGHGYLCGQCNMSKQDHRLNASGISYDKQ